MTPEISTALIILPVACMHVLLGGLLLQDSVVAGVTSIAMVVRTTGGYAPLTGVLLILAGAMAMLSLLIEEDGRLRAWALVLPQQMVLTVALGGAILAAWRGAYLDGTVHPRAFIVADQAWTVVLALTHTVGLWHWGRFE